MMGTSTRLRRELALALWVVGTGSFGLAPKAQAEMPEAHAKSEFRRGHKAYELGQFEVALEAYSAAYEAKPLSAFLFNIAQCHRQLGHFERAAFFYQRFIDETSDSATAANAQKLLIEVRERQAAEEKRAAQAAQEKQDQDLAEARAKAAHEEAVAAEQQKAAWEAQRAAEQAAPKPDLTTQAQLSARATEAKTLPPASEPTVNSHPLVKQWWFWTAVAVVAVAGGTAAIYGASAPHAPPPTLGTIHAD